MGKLKKYILPHAAFMALTLAIKLLASVGDLLIPYLMEVILDEKVPQGDPKQIYLYGGLMLLCAIGCLSFNLLANRMSAKRQRYRCCCCNGNSCRQNLAAWSHQLPFYN